MIYHYTHFRMDKTQSINNTKCCQGCGAKGILIYCWWKCKMAQPLWKTVWQCLTKLNIFLPRDSAIILLGIYPHELNLMFTQKPAHKCL